MPRASNRVYKKRNFGGKNSTNDSKSSKPVQDLDTSASASSKKLDPHNDYFYYLNKEDTCNELLDLNLLSEALKNSVVCKECQTNNVSVKFRRQVQGLASQLTVSCDSCGLNKPFLNTRYTQTPCNGKDVKSYEVNTRLTYAMRCIGRGKAAAKTFCGVMNLPSPVCRFNEGINGLNVAIEKVACSAMKAAAAEVKSSAGKDVTVAFDGTWQKRGHNSLNGVVIATSMDTGKVLDAEIFSKFCKCPDKEHTDDCIANHFGNSGSMEPSGAVEIFKRSEALYGLRYTGFLGDGDSRAHAAVSETKPYGDTKIVKLECIGHVEKRMGTRLRALKEKMKGKKLGDSKSIGGRGRLTKLEIDKLQIYYGKAIRDNTENLKGMKQAVWATFFHKASSDAIPQHGLCPTGPDSWCGFNKAIFKGKVYKHKNNLPAEVLASIKDVYRDLAAPDLLAKCLHGRTQNANESVNSVIWSRLPKSIFVQKETLKVGVYEAILSFNQGSISRCHVLEELGLSPGFYTTRAMHAADRERLRKANYDIQQRTKEARIIRRQKKCRLEDKLKEKNSTPSYGAGMH